MQDLPDVLSPIVGVRPSVLFSALLVIHIAAGMTAYIAGLLAMLSPKRAGRHPRLGRVYYWALAVIFVTAAGMSVMRWPEDAYLLVLGSVSFAAASVGFAARKIRWRGWTTFHIGGMSLSFILALTAFYVDNGPKFISQVPIAVYWIGPSLIGIPLLARACAHHTRVMRDLRATARALAAPHASFPKTVFVDRSC